MFPNPLWPSAILKEAFPVQPTANTKQTFPCMHAGELQLVQSNLPSATFPVQPMVNPKHANKTCEKQLIVSNLLSPVLRSAYTYLSMSKTS